MKKVRTLEEDEQIAKLCLLILFYIAVVLTLILWALLGWKPTIPII